MKIMPLYRVQDQQATFLKPTKFANERQMQRLVEFNLPIIFDAKLIATEFVVNVDGLQGGRIDSLALDNENSPIIIEYKKTQSESVINQGLFYLEWLLTHKGDFEIAVQKKLGKDSVVNWESPRVLVIAEMFNPYDVFGVRRMGANIELWACHFYNDEILLLENVFMPGVGLRVGKVAGKQDVASVQEKQAQVETITKMTYDLEYHLRNKSSKIKEVLDTLRERIMELQSVDGEIIEFYRKMYIGYKRGKNFCEIHVYNNDLVLWLDIPYIDLNDSKKIGKDISSIGHWGTGSVEVRLAILESVDDVMDLVRQAFEYNN